MRWPIAVVRKFLSRNKGMGRKGEATIRRANLLVKLSHVGAITFLIAKMTLYARAKRAFSAFGIEGSNETHLYHQGR